MASKNTSKFLRSCPTCVETLQNLHRMFPCGHSYCKSCLEKICAIEYKRCPICRVSIKPRRRGRMRKKQKKTVGNLIESLNLRNVEKESTSNPQAVLTRCALKQLIDCSSSYIAEKRFEEAINFLEAIILQLKGCEKLRPTVDKVMCLAELGYTGEAHQVIESTIAMIDSLVTLNKRKRRSEDYYGLTLKLAELCPLSHHETVVKLSHRLLVLAESLENKEKVEKLGCIGDVMIKTARYLSKYKKSLYEDHPKIKEQYPLMEAVLKEFYKVDDVDIEVKAEKLAWFLCDFGCVCCEASDYFKATSKYNSAIVIMKTVFSEKATTFAVFGICYRNMGCSMKHCNQLNEAKFSLNKAIELYSTSTAFKEKEKTSSLQLCEKMLQEIEELEKLEEEQQRKLREQEERASEKSRKSRSLRDSPDIAEVKKTPVYKRNSIDTGVLEKSKKSTSRRNLSEVKKIDNSLEFKTNEEVPQKLKKLRSLENSQKIEETKKSNALSSIRKSRKVARSRDNWSEAASRESSPKVEEYESSFDSDDSP